MRITIDNAPVWVERAKNVIEKIDKRRKLELEQLEAQIAKRNLWQKFWADERSDNWDRALCTSFACTPYNVAERIIEAAQDQSEGGVSNTRAIHLNAEEYDYFMDWWKADV